jgi:replication factor C large subunit
LKRLIKIQGFKELMGDDWTNKFLPSSTKEIVGQDKGIAALKAFAEGYRSMKSRAVLVHGPTGCGKTAAVTALAKELSVELVELNASDMRNKDAIERIVGAASKQMSLFAKGKLILVDEVDGLAGREDRGGLAALIKLIKETAFPIVLTANDPFDKKFSPLRKAVLMIQFEKLDYQLVMEKLKDICGQEGIEFEAEALEGLARRTDGDMRAGIIDLFLLTRGRQKLTRKLIEQLDARGRELGISEALRRIFKTKDAAIALSAFSDVDMDLNEAMLWVDENLPKEYTHSLSLQRGYEALSKADVFYGRIRRWQYWRLLVYVNAMLSAGVALAKEEKNRSTPVYERSKRILKVWIYNRKTMLKKSIGEKLARATHSSAKYASNFTLPYVQHIFRHDSIIAEEIAKELELDDKEVEWLEE